MAQIVPQVDIGEKFGTGLGSGISTGIQALLEQKLQDVKQQREFSTNYNNLIKSGYSPRIASFLAPYDANNRVKLMQGLWQRGEGQAQQNNNQSMGNLQGLGNQQPQQQTPAGMQLIQEQLIRDAEQRDLGQLPQAPQQAQQAQQQPQQERSPAEIFSQPPPLSRDTQAKLAQQKEFHNQDIEYKYSKDAEKFLKPYSETIKSAESSINTYDIIINAAEKGNIRSGNAYSALKKVGLEDFGRNLTTEIVQKEIGKLSLGAVGAFGPNSKLTDFFERTFQKTIPSLLNTPQGLVAISKLNKNNILGEKLVAEEVTNIVRENKGRGLYEANAIARERLKPKLDQLQQDSLKIAQEAMILDQGVGTEMDKLPAPSRNDRYYVSDLGTYLSSPDGLNYYREDNGQIFDWKKYNQGGK